MKKFCFFLPQFHEINENNEWWGKGFTEWTNVKRAKALYQGHKQPKVPLNDNYYCLLDKDTVSWQTELMKKYSIDGFVYYHYYFSGRLLLEKPAENLLEWTDIQQPFFFCWANHSWLRTWNGTREILIEQTYGGEKEWEDHFNYLLPFFRDSRYEKIDNKPIFMIFDSNFNEKNKMIDFFNVKCKENGFAGIYIVETYNSIVHSLNDDFQTNNPAKRILLREPSTSLILYYKKTKYSYERLERVIKRFLAKKKVISSVVRIDGNKLFDIMINDEPVGNKYMRGLFLAWDNTPRHSSRGYVINPPNKKKFFEYMDSVKNTDYLIINAWNEWAEGMILEPTEDNGYKYLEWIKEWNDRDRK